MSRRIAMHLILLCHRYQNGVHKHLLSIVVISFMHFDKSFFLSLFQFSEWSRIYSFELTMFFLLYLSLGWQGLAQYREKLDEMLHSWMYRINRNIFVACFFVSFVRALYVCRRLCLFVLSYDNIYCYYVCYTTYIRLKKAVIVI